MAKLKLTDFKKFLAETSHEELKAEMLKLFQKLSQVQDFYNQELLSPEERRKVLEDYKKRIHKEFWTSSGNPKKTSSAKLRDLISGFEKICVSKSELIELLLYRVECCYDKAKYRDYMPDAEHRSAVNAFEKALKIIVSEQLEAHFIEEVKHVARQRPRLYSWFISDLVFLTEQYFPVKV